MASLEEVVKGIQTVKKNYDIFDTGTEMEGYREASQKELNTVLNTVKSYPTRLQRLIRDALDEKAQDYHGNAEKLLSSVMATLKISLDLQKLFRAGYSTNVDLELQADHKTQQGPIDISRQEKKALLNYTWGTSIQTNLWSLILSFKEEFRKHKVRRPIFSDAIKLIASNTMMPSEMNQLDMYAESDRLSDQLAYYFYKNTTHDVEKFVWLWDHQRYAGINGLSVAIYQLLDNYIYANKDTFEQHTYYIYDDILAKSPVIEEFNNIFDGYVELDTTSKKWYLIYKIGPKLKQ